jgi:MoaE-MoaD fusion protein
MMKSVTILLFANLKEILGVERIDLQLPVDVRVLDLKKYLLEMYPILEERLGNLLFSVNHQFAYDEDEIPDQAEIAIFPPVSGGAELPTIFRITNDPIDMDELLAKITLTTTGAACIFTGMVRGETQRGKGHLTAALEYEAYIPMAEQKMAQVATEIRSQWPSVEGIAIVQRIGLLEPGTPTVLIACTAAHRDTGVFEASRYGIDRLKEIVPIWKKEIGPKGEIWVEGDYHPEKGD